MLDKYGIVAFELRDIHQIFSRFQLISWIRPHKEKCLEDIIKQCKPSINVNEYSQYKK